MKINSPNKAKIIVELTRDDMRELDITYENMDYSNIETRRVIWTILDKARKTLCRDIDPSGKMTIETIPLDTGGCVIFFTVNDTSECIRNIIAGNEDVYEFDSLDNVLDLERLMTKVIYESANAKDLRAISSTISVLPDIKKTLALCKSDALALPCSTTKSTISLYKGSS